ncbi:MAG: polysaccharide biosynthesis/export family protein [Bacteroidales bacterium]|nr:polysaccharide biosynthesis/export family protein [Bacteroidales bacterium]
MKLKLKQAIILAVLTLLIASCNSHKRLIYFKDIEETRDTAIFEKQKPEYKLQAGDLLYIQIITENQEINLLFNPTMNITSVQNLRQENMFYTGYLVNDSGYIEMPLLEKIYVSGLNIDQVGDSIKQKAYRYLKNPQVIAKLANFKFTLVGEVKTPGVKQITANQINILEALAYGGDVTYNGNRERVLLLRQIDKGTQSYKIDLTKPDIIDSDLYYIMPNDIIYVAPLKSTIFKEQSSTYLLIITTLSSTLTAMALILNLIK